MTLPSSSHSLFYDIFAHLYWHVFIEIKLHLFTKMVCDGMVSVQPLNQWSLDSTSLEMARVLRHTDRGERGSAVISLSTWHVRGQSFKYDMAFP